MVWERFDGARARRRPGASCRTSPTRRRTSCATTASSRASASRCVLPPTPETAAIFFGTWKLGAILLSMSVLYGDEGIRHRLDDSQPRVLVTDSGQRRPLRRRRWSASCWCSTDEACSTAPRPSRVAPTPRADDPAQLYYTSRHDRAGQGHRPRPPLRARPRGVHLLPRGAGRRALPRHGGVGVGRGHLAAARARGAWAPSRSSCSARAASTPRSSSTSSAATRSRTSSRRRPRCAR